METRLPHVTDYWDEQVRAIDRMASELAQLDDAGRTAALEEIRADVREHVDALPDELLIKASVAITDDLYKAACASDRWDSWLGAYLAASGATYFARLAERGYVVFYVVENEFDDPQRPLELFKPWFGSAGFVYACPQHLAFQLMEADGETPSQELLPRYITEARIVAEQLAAKCREERRHLMFLDADSVEGSFTEPLADAGEDGFITIFRNYAPAAGTSIESGCRTRPPP